MNGKEKTAREFGRILAAGGPPPVQKERLAGQRQVLIASVVSRAGGHRRRYGVVIGAALFAAAAFVVVYFAFVPGTDSDIPFYVGAATTEEKEGRFLSTGLEEHTVVRFDGGSRFDFATFTEARVVRASGARVTIDLAQGKVEARVVPGSKRIWTVRAGPYAVLVKGTIFSVDWDNVSSVLVVQADRGRVVVQGPGMDRDGVPLAAGNVLRADANAGRITFERTTGTAPLIAEAGPEAPAPEAEIAVDTAQPQRRGVKGHPRVKPKSGIEMCRRLYHEKDYVGALESAEKRGLLASERSLSEDDLWMFANAARYARRGGVSNDLFAAYRERFSDTPRANTAAFLLGKSALHSRALESAKRWFGLYLSEAPKGPLAEEALGHLIVIHSDLGNSVQARAFAEEYLRRYGGGYFSKQAQQVLSE